MLKVPISSSNFQVFPVHIKIVNKYSLFNDKNFIFIYRWIPWIYRKTSQIKLGRYFKESNEKIYIFYLNYCAESLFLYLFNLFAEESFINFVCLVYFYKSGHRWLVFQIAAAKLQIIELFLKTL